MWNSNELGKTRCRDCYDKVPRYELIQNGCCLNCRERDNSNYKLTDWERSTPESRRMERLKELNSKEKKTQDDYLKIISEEYDLPKSDGYTTIEKTNWVNCVECKEKWNSEYTTCSEKTDGKVICVVCLDKIEKEQEKLETKIEIPPKK